jgi:hypothetical protein
VFRGPYKDGRGIVIDELFVDMKTGVGLDGSGQGTDPKAMLRYSVDGGEAWSSEMQTDDWPDWRQDGRKSGSAAWALATTGRSSLACPIRLTL